MVETQKKTNKVLQNFFKAIFKENGLRTEGISFEEGDTTFEYHFWTSKHGFGHIYYEKRQITQYSPVTGGHVTVAKY